MVEKRWRLKEVAEGPAGDLAETLSVSPLLAGILLERGIADPESAERFLRPKLRDLHDPFQLPDMDRAVERVVGAVRRGEPIAIFGDYDVDGVTSACLLGEFLESLGVRVTVRLPDRALDGYGIRSKAVRDLAGEGIRLIVTVDNGTSAHGALETARDLGVDVVVTDHHEAPERLPPAVAVVNPRRADSRYPFQDLAGVGVVFKLVWAIAQDFSRGKKVSEEFRNFLLESLALVALGTVSDVVPLLGENRVLVKFGLGALEKTRRPGLRLLVEGALGESSARGLRASDLAFRIGPRLNAAGRLGSAHDAIRVLATRDAVEARELSRLLERANRRRQKIEDEIFEEAARAVEAEVDLPRARAIVLGREGWHPGIVGIVASRLVEKFYRPTLLAAIAGGRAKGSARSIPGVHIAEALSSCKECLVRFGGHEMAAGFEVDPGRLGDLRAALDAAIPMAPEEMVPEVHVDAALDLEEITWDAVEELSLLEPHGRGNPEPLFSVEDADVVGTPRLLGAEGRHVAFYVRQGRAAFRAVAFGRGGEYAALARRGAKASLLVEPKVSRWEGRSSIELIARELRIS